MMRSSKTYIVFFAIFIFLGIVLGTLYANISVKYNAGYVDTFGSDYLALYEEVTVDGFKLWQYVCRTRIRDFTLLCIIGFTAICKPAFIFYLIYIGVSAGAFISYAVMNYNIGGVGIYLLSVFPQYILYTVSVALLIKLLYKKTPNSPGIKNTWLVIMIAAVIMLIGTYLEAYINPYVLKQLFILGY